MGGMVREDIDITLPDRTTMQHDFAMTEDYVNLSGLPSHWQP